MITPASLHALRPDHPGWREAAHDHPEEPPSSLRLHDEPRRHGYQQWVRAGPAPLRPCAVYRKITNGFRSQWGAVLYADIRSVVETARRRAIRAIDAIRLTLQGAPLPITA